MLFRSSRTFLKGPFKLYSLFTKIKVANTANKDLEFKWPGISYLAYEFEPSLYNLEGSLFQIYEDNKDSTIISTAYGDNYKLKASQVIIENTLIALAVLAILYSIIMLILEIILFVSSRIRKEKSLKTFLSKYHLFNLFSILFLLLNILIMANKVFSFDILESIKPHIYLS